MAYQNGDSISAADFNIFLTTVSNVYGSGQGDRGYGQTNLMMPHVRPNIDAVPDVVEAEQWDKLRQMIMVCANHQGTNLGALAAAPLFGDTVGVLAGLSDAVTTIDGSRHNAAAESMTLAAAAYNVTRSSTWLGAMTTVVDIAFTSEDHARYFFNSGGEIRMRLTHAGGSSGQDHTLRDAFAQEIGTITFRAGASSVSGNTSDHTPYGYYTLNDTARPMINTTFDDYGYGDTTPSKNKLQVTVQRLYHSPLSTGNGTAIRFMFTLENSHMAAIGTKLEFDVYRATSYLTGITPPSFMDVSSGWVGGTGTGEQEPGTGSDTFSFTFEDVINAEPSTSITSSPITIPQLESGYLTATVVAPATLSVNGGAFAQTVEVSSGNTLRVRTTSSSAFSTALHTQITIGANVDDWVITTRHNTDQPVGSDTFPIDLGNMVGMQPSTVYESNIITIPTLASPTLLGYIGNGVGKMAVRKNGGAWSDWFDGSGAAPSFYVSSGDTIQCRIETGADISTTYGRFLFIGPNNGQFTVSTAAGAGSDTFYFSFEDIYDVQTNTLTESQPITIPLLASTSLVATVPTPGPTQAALSVNGGNWAQIVNVSSGNSLRVRAMSASSTGSTITVPINIGSNSDTWTVTTKEATFGPMVVGVSWGIGDSLPASVVPAQFRDTQHAMTWDYPEGIQAGDLLIYAAVSTRWWGRVNISNLPGFTQLGLGETCRGRDQSYRYGYKIATGNETGSIRATHGRGHVTGGMVAIRGFTSIAFHDFDYEYHRHATSWQTDIDAQHAAYLYWAFPVHPGFRWGHEPKNPVCFEHSYVLNEPYYNTFAQKLRWLLGIEKHGGALGVRFNEPNEQQTTMSWEVGPKWHRHGIIYKIKLH